MIAWLLSLWSKYVVADCPPELHPCESCRDLHCDERQAAECQYRIAVDGKDRCGL